MRQDDLQKPERRRFLKGVAAAGGPTAFVALAGKAATGGSEAEPKRGSVQEAKGYHLTPHIRDYYESLRS